jgi:hypothetical protein
VEETVGGAELELGSRPPLVNSIEGEALRNTSAVLATSVNNIPRRTTTSNCHL